jgi:hypothetical protein
MLLPFPLRQTTLLLLSLPPTSEEDVRSAIAAKLPSLGSTELKSVIYVNASSAYLVVSRVQNGLPS